jgi:flagellin
LLDVAEGALSSVDAMLQRIRTLLVQARSDLNTPSDLKSIQFEIDGLKQEINKIATSVNFNGVKLLDGSLDNSPPQPARVQEIQANPNVSGDVPTKTVTNADGLGNPGPLVQNATVGNNVEQSTVEVQVVGFDQNAVDPITGPIGGPGLYVQVTAYSTDPSFGAGASSTSITAVPENAGPQFAQFTTPASAGASVFFQFTLANLTRNDVGTGQAFTTYKNTPAGSGQPLSVNVRGDEGTDAQVGIPAVTSQSLGIADITVAQPVNVDPFNTPQYTDSNTIGAKDAEVRVSNAIDQVGAARAQVGAQTVAIENSANDTAIQAVAEQAGRSAIRDADIGQETTALAKDQILEKIATSTIVSVQDSEKSMAGTLSDIISSGPKAK